MKITSTILLSGLLANAADAAIGLVDRFSTTDSSDAGSYTINGSGLDLTGASKVVVTTGVQGPGRSEGLEFSAITFGGADLGRAITDVANNRSRSSVWYLDLEGQSLVGSDFDLTVSGGDNDGVGFAAYALSGTAPGFFRLRNFRQLGESGQQ